METQKSGMGKIRLIPLAVLIVTLAISNISTYINLHNQIITLNDEKNALESRMNTLQIKYDELDISFHALNTSHFKLQNQYFDLQSRYEDLESSYHALNTSYFNLQIQYEELNGRYAALQANYQNVQTNFNSLMQSYSSLQRDYEVEKALRIGNSLESYYDFLRQELGPTGAEGWWLTPTKSYWQAQADFAADLALHDLRLIYWPSIEKDYFEDVGEYSYDTARKKIDEIVSLIEIKSYDTYTERIKKILDFINRYIHYESEVNDVFLAPVETLGFKSGDCDDFSILVSALFEAVGIDAAIGFFTNEKLQYHAMVLIHVDDLTGYGYYYFSDLTSLGLEKGKWIVIEPQTTIENQATDWVRQWILFVAAPLDAD